MAIPEPYDLLANWPGWQTMFDPLVTGDISRQKSGVVRTRLGPKPIWQMAVVSRLLPPNAHGRLKGLVQRLHGRQTLILGYEMARCFPIAYPNGSWPTGSAFNGQTARVQALGANNFSMTLDRLPADFQLSDGDMLQVGENNLHRVVEDAKAGPLGLTPMFEVDPPFWPGPRWDRWSRCVSRAARCALWSARSRPQTALRPAGAPSALKPWRHAMPRGDNAANIAAAQALVTAEADFLWFVARERATGAPVMDGMWSGVGTVSAQIVDPMTGMVVTRTYVGTYGLVAISDIALVTGVSVQPITITLSQVNDRVAQLIRQYDLKQAHVELHRGRINPQTQLMVGPAAKRFVGFVDDPEIVEGKDGEEGHVSLTCVPYSQEMLRSNPDTRSQQSQQNRNRADDFFIDAAVVGDWTQFWGKSDGTIGANAKGSLVGRR